MTCKSHPKKYLLVLKTCSTCLQRNIFTSSKTSWRYLAKTSWRRLGRHKIVTLKTSWKHVLKMSWRHVFNTSWIYLGDKKNIYWGYLYTYLGITNINMYLTSLYFANLYLTIVTRIQNVLIRTQQIHYSSYFGTGAGIFILRIRISVMTGFVLWNQLNSNSTLQKRWGNKNRFLSSILRKHI